MFTALKEDILPVILFILYTFLKVKVDVGSYYKLRRLSISI